MNSHFPMGSKHLSLSESSNRRIDQPVRSAIDAVQNLLFDPQASVKIFPLVLEYISNITQSDHSVIFVSDTEKISPISTNHKITLNAIHTEKGVAFTDGKVLSHWAIKKALPMRPTFFNGPIPKIYLPLLINPKRINSICLLPIVSQNQIRAICILGKTTGGYSGDMIRRLMPLLGSIICVLQSADSVKGNFIGLDQKIADNRYLSSLLSSSPIAVIVVSLDNTILTSNPSAQEMFYPDSVLFNEENKKPINLAGQSILSYFPDFESLFKWSNQKSRYGYSAPLKGPQVWENQTAIKGDGTHFLVNMTVFRYTHGNQRFTTLQIQDITSMHENAEEYQRASQQLNALTHLVPVGIIRVDINWNCVYANDRWHDFSGLITEETTGQQWINAIHNDDVKSLLEELRESLQLGNDYQKEIRLVSPLGQIRWMDFNTRVLFDEKGSVESFLGTFADITERLLHQEKLRQVAEYDGLTGLANRNLFQDRLQQAFYSSEREDSLVSIMFLDLDGFKDINDTLGHDAGDILLQEVSQRLLNILRRNDTIARFGGDEFVVLIGRSDDNCKICHVAQKIIEAIAEPYFILDQEIFVTVSIGIAEGTYWTNSPKKLLKQADTALYLAKKEGKNNYQLFNEQLDQDSKHRISLANQLRHAIDKQQYSMLFQPIANVATKKIIGYEALLRFTTQQGRLIQPDEFIPILEETGMILDAGQWVIEKVCQQLQGWQKENVFPENGFIAFNVSPKQLLDESIVKLIKKYCHSYDIDPHHLVMEITETVIINKPKKVEKILNSVKNIGLRLALDDFGTGYSSLSYLQKYPFDHIKVDKSFTDDLLNDSNDAKITKAIIALASSLGLKVTAEGVENSKSLDMIKEFGANYYQGYFLSEPMIAKDVIKIQQNSSAKVSHISSIKKSID